jgi:carbohydrate-binding DOMON domain-containing protein
VEQPAAVADRYVRSGPPGALTVTASAPGVVAAKTATVTGTTAPGARVVISAIPTDVAATTSVVAVRAAADGSFHASVPVGFLTNVLTVTAARGNATGYARLTVVSSALPGPALLDVTDPAGDDHGPGTYAYPTAADFHDGAFDLTRFQVIDAGDTVYLLTTLRDLTPTFGSPLGAQLLDIFVRDPAATSFSTAAPFPTRNFTIAADSAWSSRLEVQGFAGPVFVSAGGASLGDVAVTANQATSTILFAVPKAALGTPAAGWVFTVAVHGQDGFNADQARTFAPTAQPFQFGVCGTGVSSPICALDPAGVPKVIDTITPPGVTQSSELDPTQTVPPALHGVRVG